MNSAIDNGAATNVSLQSDKIPEQKELESLGSSDVAGTKSVQNFRSSSRTSNKPNHSSSAAKKSKILTERKAQPLKYKTQPKQDVLAKKPNVEMRKSSDFKYQNFPTKKAPTSMQDKQTRRTRPLSTEFSLSSTSPAVLCHPVGNMGRVEGSSLRHSWHGMPSSVRPRNKGDDRRGPYAQKLSKSRQKGECIRANG